MGLSLTFPHVSQRSWFMFSPSVSLRYEELLQPHEEWRFERKHFWSWLEVSIIDWMSLAYFRIISGCYDNWVSLIQVLQNCLTLPIKDGSHSLGLVTAVELHGPQVHWRGHPWWTCLLVQHEATKYAGINIPLVAWRPEAFDMAEI